MIGPKAPRDPEEKRKSFYVMRNKQIAGSPQPDGSGLQMIFLNNDRLVGLARIAGGICEERILGLLRTTQGIRQLVHAVGVSVEGDDPTQTVDFCFQMYGKLEGIAGTCCHLTLRADGMEQRLLLSDVCWGDSDTVPGQFRFAFPQADSVATVSVRFYLKDGFDVPECGEESAVDFDCPAYREMLQKSLLQTSNNVRLKTVLERARKGEDVTLAFIGGSITQGAGAIPINTACYAWRTFEAFCALAGKGTQENIHYIKAGVGGTSSELGMVRYEKELRERKPDLCVVEFAVNDEGDETGGESYDCLVRRILEQDNQPAVILLFSVFSNDENLQERLRKVGEAYALPMVSIKDCVTEQFYEKPGQGRVLSKNQFFYDIYHPNNTGHRIMADCLVQLLRTVDGQAADGQPQSLTELTAPYGTEFVRLHYFDRSSTDDNVSIDCGDFSERDTQLQTVERDTDTVKVPIFTENWMHKSGTKPFVLELTCTALLIVEKDSGMPEAGCAQISVDGETVRVIDPHEVGWPHANALICFRGKERKKHHVEIAMQPGDEEKEFTVLGFAYVE